MTKLNLPCDYLSPTQVNMYLRCPKQYEFRYVEGLKIPPAAKMVEGSCMHTALDSNNKSYITRKKNLPSGELYEVFADTFSDTQDTIGDWGEDNESTIMMRGQEGLKRYCGGIAKTYKPHRSEKKVTPKIKGIPFLAFIDTIGTMGSSKNKIIVDYKVSGRAKSQSDVDNSLQLWVYMEAEKLRSSALCVFTPKKVDMKICSQPYSQHTQTRLHSIVKDTATAISAGNFPRCGPDNFLCNRKWCGYYDRCFKN